MRILVQITDSVSGYLNNVAAAYKRVEIKGKLPEELKEKFKKQLTDLAVTTEEIRAYVEHLPEQ